MRRFVMCLCCVVGVGSLAVGPQDHARSEDSEATQEAVLELLGAEPERFGAPGKRLYWAVRGRTGAWKETAEYLKTETVGEDRLALAIGHALALERSWDSVAASAQIRSLLKEHPGNAQLLFHLGMIEIRRGGLEVGLEYLREALRADPAHVEASLELALYSDNDEEVLEGCARVILLADPKSESAQRAERRAAVYLRQRKEGRK